MRGSIAIVTCCFALGCSASHAGVDGQVDTSGQRQRDRAVAGGQGAARLEPIRKTGPEIGRNDPCPCGSGKKYKKCHGRSE